MKLIEFGFAKYQLIVSAKLILQLLRSWKGVAKGHTYGLKALGPLGPKAVGFLRGRQLGGREKEELRSSYYLRAQGPLRGPGPVVEWPKAIPESRLPGQRSCPYRP